MRTTAATPPALTWTAEPEGKGFWRVFDQNAVLVARHCLMEDAFVIGAAPHLLQACRFALWQLSRRQPDLVATKDALAKAVARTGHAV